MKKEDEIFIPYGRQKITQDDIKAVVKVLQSTMLTQGPMVPQFEKAISSEVGASYAIAVNSATSALHIACKALNLAQGDWVWTSPITFVASANCALYCGANIDFIDININNGLIDVDKLEEKLIYSEKNGRLPKIIIPVHLSGSSCNMKRIDELSKQFGFKIIEDASHAIGGKYNGVKVGSCQYSDVTVFSFHPVKIITTAEGGVACTNKQEIASKMRVLRSHGITKEVNSFKYKPSGPWTYEQQELGYNYKMNDIQAALGISQLKRLNSIIHKRNKQRDYYQKAIKEENIQMLEIPLNVKSSVHLAIIRLTNKSAAEHKKIFESMLKQGIGVQLHYSPVHMQPYFRELGFRENSFPEAKKYAESAITIPIYEDLTVEEQNRVIDALSNAIRS